MPYCQSLTKQSYTINPAIIEFPFSHLEPACSPERELYGHRVNTLQDKNFAILRLRRCLCVCYTP
jgi:hypothetical protein